MKKLIIAFLEYWLEENNDALVYIVRHVPENPKDAKRFLLGMKKDAQKLAKQNKLIKALLETL